MRILFTLSLALGLLSCTSHTTADTNTTCDYPYRANLDKYLLNEVQYTIPEEETILAILPLNGCNPCLKSTIDMLAESKEKNLELIVSTNDERDIKKFDLDKIDIPKAQIHYDLKSR